jgi:hypothetical protein
VQLVADMSACNARRGHASSAGRRSRLQIAQQKVCCGLIKGFQATEPYALHRVSASLPRPTPLLTNDRDFS